MRFSIFRFFYSISIEYTLQSITPYDPRHTNVLTYGEHKIWLKNRKCHNNYIPPYKKLL